MLLQNIITEYPELFSCLRQFFFCSLANIEIQKFVIIVFKLCKMTTIPVQQGQVAYVTQGYVMNSGISARIEKYASTFHKLGVSVKG